MIHDYEAFKKVIREYGELHAVIEEIDNEVEIRNGQVEWHDEVEAFTLTQYGEPIETHQWDRVVYAYKPQELRH